MKDYHLHSPYGDGKNTIDEMVAAAQQAGFKEVAFAEHFTWLFVQLKKAGINTAFTILPEEVQRYYAECCNAEQKHGIKVLKGFEIGYIENDEEPLKRFVAQAKPDILLLAVHHLELLNDWVRKNRRVEKAGYSIYLGGEAFDELTLQYDGFENVCKAYFRRVEHAIQAGFESISPRVGVAHLTMFQRHPSYDLQIAQPFIGSAIEMIARKSLALELNFHGVNSTNQPRPPFYAARNYLTHGGREVWFGSDAHSVQEVLDAAGRYEIFKKAMN